MRDDACVVAGRYRSFVLPWAEAFVSNLYFSAKEKKEPKTGIWPEKLSLTGSNMANMQ